MSSFRVTFNTDIDSPNQRRLSFVLSIAETTDGLLERLTKMRNEAGETWFPCYTAALRFVHQLPEGHWRHFLNKAIGDSDAVHSEVYVGPNRQRVGMELRSIPDPTPQRKLELTFSHPDSAFAHRLEVRENGNVTFTIETDSMAALLQGLQDELLSQHEEEE